MRGVHWSFAHKKSNLIFQETRNWIWFFLIFLIDWFWFWFWFLIFDFQCQVHFLLLLASLCSIGLPPHWMLFVILNHEYLYKGFIKVWHAFKFLIWKEQRDWSEKCLAWLLGENLKCIAENFAPVWAYFTKSLQWKLAPVWAHLIAKISQMKICPCVGPFDCKKFVQMIPHLFEQREIAPSKI